MLICRPAVCSTVWEKAWLLQFSNALLNTVGEPAHVFMPAAERQQPCDGLQSSSIHSQC
jgi:hypothetical protein